MQDEAVNTWTTFSKRLRNEYFDEDSERMTKDHFLIGWSSSLARVWVQWNCSRTWRKNTTSSRWQKDTFWMLERLNCSSKQLMMF